MTEPTSDDEQVRRAEQELGGTHPYVVDPVEESEEAVSAVEDDTPLPSLAPGADTATER